MLPCCPSKALEGTGNAQAMFASHCQVFHIVRGVWGDSVAATRCCVPHPQESVGGLAPPNPSCVALGKSLSLCASV